jgi:hypothetical protein
MCNVARPSARSLPPCDDSRPEKQLRRHFHLIDANHGLISDITAITTALDSPTCTFTIPGRRLRDCGHSLDAWSVRTSFFITRTGPLQSFVSTSTNPNIYISTMWQWSFATALSCPCAPSTPPSATMIATLRPLRFGASWYVS